MQSITEIEDHELVQAGLLGFTSLLLPVLSERRTPPRFIVLLVDDNDDLRYVMGLTLSIMGFDVVSCRDADSASAVFRSRGDVNLLITDLEMPGRSGIELARELCALCSSLPVLVVSGAHLSDEVTREMRERNWRFVAKPYALPALSANISALLNIAPHSSEPIRAD